MSKKPKTAFERLNEIINAWQTLAPNATFAGMTLAEFKAITIGSFESRADLATLDTQREAAKNRRQDSDKAANKLALRVVAGVLADAAFGPNSDLYAEMGYVRESEKDSGLHRIQKPKTPNP